MIGPDEHSARSAWCLAPIALVCCAGAASAGCWNDVDLPENSGSLGGQVLISGGVRGARLWVDQLDSHTGEVQLHVGEAVTDTTGHFAIETGTENGIFRITAQGGTFEDLATGATIQLDDTDEIVSLIWYDLLDLREDALVSPIGLLVEARTMERLPVLGDMTAAFEETRASLHRHFGNVDWGAVRPWPLGERAISPTEPVRAAFVLAALSVLACDIAGDAQAGPQEVNVYRLMQRWTEDVRAGIFDGNDGDDRTSGSGLQLGFCPPVDPVCVVPGADCDTGRCRRLCDLYSGTPRALLAGAMSKVINDRGPGGLNQTGLDLANTLSVVRAVSDDMDPGLFDASACIEALDRVPPRLRFDAPTPGEAAFVRSMIQIRVLAVDDVDLSPDTSLIGFTDLDWDPANAVAWTTIETAALADGPLRVVARAVDLTGNTATIERAFAVDNTAPVVTLDMTGFYVDGSTWWTASAAPVLTGTVLDAAPVSIKAVIAGGSEVSGTISGTSWTIALPAGALDPGGTSVQIVAVDAAGNQSSVTQRLRPDLDPPVLSFQASTVNDEADDGVTFAADHSPEHVHAGMPVDLTTSMGCPSLTKFSYLLGSTTPEYTLEFPGPNPIQYQLVTDDPGVGIATGATEYRVGLRAGLQTIWVLDWTSAGNGIPIGTGVTRFPIGIFSDVVTGLATTEGIYDVELRATDRLGRTTTAARCFDLHLRAPPLEFEPAPPRPTKLHAYALDSLSLAPNAQFDQIAARLLNDNATGASLIDQDVFNGTTATIYLTVTVMPPSIVMAQQSFVVDNAPTNVSQAACSVCNGAMGVPGDSGTVLTPMNTLRFPVRVFELVGGIPDTEIPCLAPCQLSDTVFRFAIPPRAGGGQSARAFRVMTMIGQVAGLWPRNQPTDPGPPYEDTSITWTDQNFVTTSTQLTGLVNRVPDPSRTGCVTFDATGAMCLQEGTLVPYRALVSATLTFSTETRTEYGTAATLSQTPVASGPVRVRSATSGWTTSESVLP